MPIDKLDYGIDEVVGTATLHRLLLAKYARQMGKPARQVEHAIQQTACHVG